MLPCQTSSIFLNIHVEAFKANIYTVLFIAWLAMIYLNLRLYFGCYITALGFTSGYYTARTILNFGGGSDHQIEL